MPSPKNTICLWYDRDAEAAARFYAATFPDSAVTAVHHAPGDYPSGQQGDVLTLGPLASTRMACPEPLSSQEAQQP